MQWQPIQMPAGMPQQQVILQQQQMGTMAPYQQQVYWQQYQYPQWTVPAMQISQTPVPPPQPKLAQRPLPDIGGQKPPLPPDSGVNPAPPVEPPKEEKPPLPPEPPPPEPAPPKPTVMPFLAISEGNETCIRVTYESVYIHLILLPQTGSLNFSNYVFMGNREKTPKSCPTFRHRQPNGNSNSNNNSSGRNINRTCIHTNSNYISGNNNTLQVNRYILKPLQV